MSLLFLLAFSIFCTGIPLQNDDADEIPYGPFVFSCFLSY